jgi:uncharacterized protein
VNIGVDFSQLREICERYGVARLEVFGSVSRGEDGPGSDIDLLYELTPDASPDWSFYDIEDELARLFGRPVDVAPRHGINNHLQDQVLRDAKLLYAA